MLGKNVWHDVPADCGLPSLFWEWHSAAQVLPRAQGCAVFWAFWGRRSMQKGCTHAFLCSESSVQSHSDAARARICTPPVPAWSCMCSLLAVPSHTNAAPGAGLYRDRTAQARTGKRFMRSRVCTFCCSTVRGAPCAQCCAKLCT